MRSFVWGKSRYRFRGLLERIGLSLKALLFMGQPERGRGKAPQTHTTRRSLPRYHATDRQPGPVIWVVLLVSMLILFGNGVMQPRIWPMQPAHPRGFTHQPRVWQSNPLDLPGMFRQALGNMGHIVISHWPGGGSESEQNIFVETAPLAVHPPGDYDLRAAPSLNAQQIDQILASYGSPATSTGQIWVTLGQQYGIDPAFAIAFFIHESSAGTNPNWAGVKPGGTTTHNVGNIICAGYATCYGRFRDYPSWEAGIEDWYRLIAVEYIQGRGTVTVQQIIPIYAPSFENNVDGYIGAVTRMVDTWRTSGVAP